ncbi:MAG: hypothetical protein KJN90_01375 [Gammaproteobacteria bacterium]|nr:hypothetical protein [Gammaproteobacteria bacterium]
MRVLKLLVLVGSLIFIQPAIGEVASDERASAAGTSAQEPISKNNNDYTFWFEEIDGDHTVYWQFIEVYDKVNESLENVARRLTKYMADHRIEKAISAGGESFN